VPDSPRATGRTLRLIPIALFLTAVTLAGCGARIPDISVPSIPDMSSAGAGGSASFNIDGSTFTVAQSGTIQTSFPGAKQISYSGPLGCKGHYFNASYTEDIDVYFHYFKKDAYLLIDNGGSPVYHFGPPQRQGHVLVFSNPTPSDRKITVEVNCPAPRLARGRSARPHWRTLTGAAYKFPLQAKGKGN